MEKTRLCLLLSTNLNDKLREIANEQEISKNALINMVLKNYIKLETKEKS